MRRARSLRDPMLDPAEYANKLWDEASRRTKTIRDAWWIRRWLWEAAIEAWEVAADDREVSGFNRYARSYRARAEQLRQLLESSRKLNADAAVLKVLARQAYATGDETAQAELIDRLQEMNLLVQAGELQKSFRGSRWGEPFFDRQAYRQTLFELGL